MIQGSMITLRALEDRDQETLRCWRNDPKLSCFHFSAMPLSQISQKRWYENYSESSNSKIFIIENDQNSAIGYTVLKNIDHKNRNAEIGLYLDPSFQGKGYGRDSFETLIRFCFEELNMHRVYLQVFAFNTRAISLYERIGFKTEGCLREAFFTQNDYHDIILMSILSHEWAELQ